MKVKLLRKLRKRFYWYKRSPGDYCWTFYDRKHNVELYCFKEGMIKTNDMLLHELLHRIGYGFLFVRLRERLEKKGKKRAEIALLEKYKPFFT